MCEPKGKQSQDVNYNLKTLIRGLTQDNTTEVYEAYRVLFQIGAPAIPQIQDVLLKFNSTRVRYSKEFRYISGLVNLIHDIDEVKGKEIVRRLKGDGCNVALARILDSICKFTLNDYVQYVVCGIKIFEHKKIITRQNIKSKLQQWLNNIPNEDLSEIERIYILRQEDLESLGSYKPILYRINIVWINSSPVWSPMLWLNNFIIEYTLYHEIGHHVHRHTFGQVQTQEEEADEYADRIMFNSNHLLFRVLRLFKT